MISFSRLSIFNKLMVVFSINFILFCVLIFAYLMPQYKTVMFIEKKQGLEHNVEMIISLIEEYAQRHKSGEFDLETAQSKALERINTIRYQEGKNYFWVQDASPKMILHPTNPKLNGSDLGDYKDPNGKRLFSEMAEICKKQGSGFVEYQWSKTTTETPTDKLSYVELYKPWGWIIGTGIWVDDLGANLLKELDNIYLYSYLLILLIIIIISVIVVAVSKNISNNLRRATSLLSEISKGDFSSFIKSGGN